MSVISRFVRYQIPHILNKYQLCVRSFSRQARAKVFNAPSVPKVKSSHFKNVNHAVNPVQREPVSRATLFRKWVVQCIFSVGAVGAVYAYCCYYSVIAKKFPDREEGKMYFDDYWQKMCKTFNCDDSLINRRALQIMGFNLVCFFVSFIAIRSTKMVHKVAASPLGSFYSPLTSIFMHGSFMHLAMNMLGLYAFTIGLRNNGPPIQGYLDRWSHQHLIAFLIAGGVFTSLVCSLRGVFLGPSLTVSCGFSGALSALVMYSFTQKPDSRLGLIFMPGHSFSARDMAKAAVLVDFALLCTMGYHRIDGFGHLVGFLFGYLYSKYFFKYWDSEYETINQFIYELEEMDNE